MFSCTVGRSSAAEGVDPQLVEATLHQNHLCVSDVKIGGDGVEGLAKLGVYCTFNDCELFIDRYDTSGDRKL